MTVSGYKEIERVFRDRISSGEWAPGALLPSEAELAAEFKCARGTISRAMAELNRSGIVTRKRRAGTKVNDLPLRPATFHIPVVREGVESSGKRYSFALLERNVINPSAIVRARMNVASNRMLLHLRTLHMADHQPYIHEDRWVNFDIVPEILATNLEVISANEWLVRNAPLSRGELLFSARSAELPETDALCVESGAALFIMERITWMGDAAITFVTMAFRPGYQMRTRI